VVERMATKKNSGFSSWGGRRVPGSLGQDNGEKLGGRTLGGIKTCIRNGEQKRNSGSIKKLAS